MNCTLPTHHLLGWAAPLMLALGLGVRGQCPVRSSSPVASLQGAQVEGLAGAHLAVWGERERMCDGTWHMVVSMNNALQCFRTSYCVQGWRLGFSWVGPQPGPVAGGQPVKKSFQSCQAGGGSVLCTMTMLGTCPQRACLGQGHQQCQLLFSLFPLLLPAPTSNTRHPRIPLTKD